MKVLLWLHVYCLYADSKLQHALQEELFEGFHVLS